MTVVELGRRRPPPREPRLRLWGCFWPASGGPQRIGTAADQGLDPSPAGGDLWLRPHFIAARGTRADFTVAFRQPARPEYLAMASNDR